jgi:hypothetical protein
MATNIIGDSLISNTENISTVALPPTITPSIIPSITVGLVSRIIAPYLINVVN